MDLYIVLGVRQGATESEIKRAYRRLARRHHPDINPGDRTAEERFRQVVDAYETLVDPARRSRYDSGHETDPPTAPAKGGFEGFDFSSQGPDYSAIFGDLFAEVLSEHGTRRGSSERGADLHQEVQISFENALTGVERSLTLTRCGTCRACAGTGVARPSAGPCEACQGGGVVRSVRGYMVFARPCGACDGTGQSRPRPCVPCGASGVETRAETIQVGLPAGIADGDRVRVASKGHAGLRGGEAGDLFVTVKVGPHAMFRREGADLHTVVALAVHEAALGARVDVPVPDGVAKLRVPPGTQSGQSFRLRERGVPSVHGRARGDVVVEVRLMLPKVLDERSKELLREFGRINRESVRGPMPSERSE